MLCDTGREIGLAYGACDSAEARTAKRISYVIDPGGKIVKAYPSVAAAQHPGQVLEDIDAEEAAPKA